MSFLIVLGCLIAERFLLRHEALRQPLWYERWFELQQSLPVPLGLRQGAVGILVLIAPPAAAVLLAQHLLGDALGGIPGALFAALVLLYSLGPKDLDREVSALVDAGERAEPATLERLARALAGNAPESVTGDLDIDPVHGVFRAALQRIFGVLFWFLLLGPVGALGYRMASLTVQLAREQARLDAEPAAGTLVALMDWLPARMLAGLFALAGCFDTAVKGWRHCDTELARHSGLAVVVCAGTGAMQLDRVARRENNTRGPDCFLLEAAMSLVWRSVVLFVALLGLVSISGWLL
jgi:membrane protein required for beta-lactamase induction